MSTTSVEKVLRGATVKQQTVWSLRVLMWRVVVVSELIGWWGSTFTWNRAKQSIRIPGIVSDTQLTTSLHLGLSGSIKYQNETNENKLYLQSLP